MGQVQLQIYDSDKMFLRLVPIYTHISLAVLGSWEPGVQFNYSNLTLGSVYHLMKCCEVGRAGLLTILSKLLQTRYLQQRGTQPGRIHS